MKDNWAIVTARPTFIYTEINKLGIVLTAAMLTLPLSFYATTTSASPVYSVATGNYYEYVAGELEWDDARSAALSSNFMGVSGHLANITTAGENDFIESEFGFTADTFALAWIGGYDPTATGSWIWADGPESGNQFSAGPSPTPPFLYANWGGVEPNNPGTFATINLANAFSGIDRGQWADSRAPNPSDPIKGYIVEYEASLVPEPSSLALFGVGSMGLMIVRRRR